MASKSGQEQASTEQVEELLDTVDKTLDRLKTLYEQYFLGIQKQAPSFIHSDVERKLRDLTQINIRNTGLRYRLATLQQKFGSYNSYWRRTLRQIENGTYARNLAKIGREAARTGSDIPEEILAAMPKRMREQVLRDRDAALAIAKRRQQEDVAAAEMLALDDEEPAQINDAPVRDTKTRSGAHVLSEEDADIDFNALFSAFDDDAPKTIERARRASTLPPAQRAKKASTMPPAQRPQPLRMPTPNATPTGGTARAPSSDEPADHTTNVLPVTARPTPIRGSGGAARLVGQPPSEPGSAARPAGQQPSAPGSAAHDPNAPIASGQPTPSSGIPRPVGHQASGPAGLPRTVGQQPNGPAGVPRPVGHQPSGPAGVPRPVGQQPSAPMASGQATPSSGIPRPVGQQGSGPAGTRAMGQQPSVPTASGQPTPSSGIPRPVGHQASGPAGTPRAMGQQPTMPTASGQPTPSSGIPRPVGQQASGPAGMPRAMGQQSSAPTASGQPTPSSGIPRSVGQQASGPADAPRSEPIRVDVSQPTQMPADASRPTAMPNDGSRPTPMGPGMRPPNMRPATGPSPVVTQPIPRPAPSQQSRPIPVIPGSAAQTGPVAVESMSGPFPRESTGATQAIPKPGAGAIPKPAAGQTQAIPNPGAGPTQAIPKPGGGQTQAIPNPGPTQAIPKPGAAQTQAIPKPGAAQTQAIPKPGTGQTQAIPKPGTGQTQAIPKPGTGQTQAIPKSATPTGQTQAIPKPGAQSGQTQALPKAPMRPPAGMSEADVNALHAKYVKAKESIGEKVDAGSREKLLKTITQTAPKIMEQYKASGVDFSVVVKDNQVVIKAKPKT